MSREQVPRCDFDQKKLILRLDLTFQAEISAIAPVVLRVMEVAREMSCIRRKEFEVEISLREALVNAIVHGCQEDPRKSIQLSACCDESRGMLLIVRDPGPGFIIEQIQSPVMGDNLVSAHGRGIYMINQLMDDVRFLGKGTEIHMLKR